eukprot:GHVS01085721.1.p1 GENE.GHVS01085721.1~~GHVS01085721.1.p1  ORF type:complete len:102 (-),score=18.27 GHVS01085721.1:477-782(-)
MTRNVFYPWKSLYLPISLVVFSLTTTTLVYQFTYRRQQNIRNAIEMLNRAEVGHMHYMKLDSIAPPIPYDHFTEQGEKDAQRLMREHSTTNHSARREPAAT